LPWRGLVTIRYKGAIGYIGASNSSYWDEDYWWGVGYKTVVSNPTYSATALGAYDGIFHDHGEPTSEYYIYNDAINFRGNLAVTQANGSSTAYYWQIYHLMGDPSVMTYFKVPPANTVTHASTILITATSFTVQAVPALMSVFPWRAFLKAPLMWHIGKRRCSRYGDGHTRHGRYCRNRAK
jgi:hypothetical protein